MTRLPFGTKYFPLNQARFQAAFAGGMGLNNAEWLFWRNLSAVFFIKE